MNSVLGLRSKEITVEVTNRCAAHCLSCPRESFTQPLGHMDMALFKRIIDDAAANGYTSLDTCGFGDPLLDPLLRERFEYVKTHHSQMAIYTSTTCGQLQKKNLPWIVETVDTLKISIFGTTAEVYDAMHRGHKFDRAKENILNLVEARQRFGQPYLIGLFLQMPGNVHQTDEWIAFWEPKLDEVMVWKPHNWIEGRQFREQTPTRRSCGRPENGNLTVGVDGRVSICCFDYNKTVTIGDLNQECIADVRSKSPLLRDILDAHARLDFSSGDLICNTCDQTYEGYDDVLVYASNNKREVGSVTTHEERPVPLGSTTET